MIDDEMIDNDMMNDDNKCKWDINNSTSMYKNDDNALVFMQRKCCCLSTSVGDIVAVTIIASTTHRINKGTNIIRTLIVTHRIIKILLMVCRNLVVYR